MHGADVNALNVYLATSDAAGSSPSTLGSPIWTKRGEQGTAWKSALVELGPHGDKNVQVRMVGHVTPEIIYRGVNSGF